MIRSKRTSRQAWVVVVVFAMLFASCGGGSKQDSGTATPPAPAPGAPPAQAPPPAQPAAQAIPADQLSWEEIDALVAPIALYPDVVIGAVLACASQPQEVLDAATWLSQNPTLDSTARDAAAEQAGFSTSARSLMQFPPVLDMMASNIDWTRQLGVAFAGDQKAVLDSIQYLRGQAKESGALQTTPQQEVKTETVAQKEVITIEPQDPEVVYVPQYDPATVYQAPAGTTVTTTAPDGTTTTTVVGGGTTAPATTTTAPETTTVVQEGHSTGSLVATGLISFGIGMILGAAIFDNDDYYYPNYRYGGMYYGGGPWYPPPVYRPPHYPGYHPYPSYRPPPGYGNNWRRNDININVNNNYFSQWNQTNIDRGVRPRPVTNPTAGRPRPSTRPATRPATRPSPGDVAAARPGTREGRPEARPATRPESRPDTRPATRPESRPDTRPATRPESRPDARPATKPESRPATAKAPAEKPAPSTRPATSGDRGYPKTTTRPASSNKGGSDKTSGFSKQASGGKNSRDASNRGKQSMKGSTKQMQPQKQAR